MDRVRYLALIEDVQEVSLTARADWDYWSRLLKSERLVPYRGGRGAEIQISGTRLKWMGIRFCELVIAIAASEQEDGSTRDGMYLVTAFNSSRMLAWMERAFFGTPYWYAPLHVEPDVPSVAMRGEEAGLRMERRATGPPSATTEGQWEGPVYLAGKRYFQVKIGGVTEHYAFEAGDVFELSLSGRSEVFQRLMESGCRGEEWQIRRRAVHGRSATFGRREAI
jgi:hypothetical protein